MKSLLILSAICLFIFEVPATAQTHEKKIKAIDSYASTIDSNLKKYRREHKKCCDCFGTDKYFADSTTLVKFRNYQSCFRIDFYYKKEKLVLVTIDGSFKRTCGYTEANYCWDSSVVRDYRARIYYNGQKILKETETGTKPCCEIKPCGDYAGSIDFKNKAAIFLKKFGKKKDIEKIR